LDWGITAIAMVFGGAEDRSLHSVRSCSLTLGKRESALRNRSVLDPENDWWLATLNSVQFPVCQPPSRVVLTNAGPPETSGVSTPTRLPKTRASFPTGAPTTIGTRAIAVAAPASVSPAHSRSNRAQRGPQPPQQGPSFLRRLETGADDRTHGGPATCPCGKCAAG